MSIVTVIGAGIAGCTAARELLKLNYNVLLIEKSSSIGGRLATRRLNEFKADTGAQFITARSNAFKEQFIQPGLDGGYIHVWSLGGFTETNLSKLKSDQSDGHPRYSSHLGLNGLVQQAFSDLKDHPNFQIYLNTRVTEIILSNQKSQFQVELDNKDSIQCNHVVITMPLPQAIPMIQNVVLQGENALKFNCNLNNVNQLAKSKVYDHCLCLIAILPRTDSEKLISNQKAIRIDNDEIIQWIASNNSKKMSTTKSGEFDIITIHCNPQFSTEYYDSCNDEIYKRIIESSLLRQYSQNIQSWSLKKWKYAVPLFNHSCNVNSRDLEDSVSLKFL